MKKFILAVLAMAVMGAGQVQAGDYEKIESNKNFTGYLDYDTLKMDGDKMTFWIKNEFTKKGVKNLFPKAKTSVSHSMEKFTADCQNEVLYSHEIHIYDTKKKVVYSENSYTQVSMIPDSVNANTYKYICGILASAKEKIKQQNIK